MSRVVRISLAVSCLLTVVAFALGVASVWTFGPTRTALGQTAALLMLPAVVGLFVALVAALDDNMEDTP